MDNDSNRLSDDLNDANMMTYRLSQSEESAIHTPRSDEQVYLRHIQDGNVEAVEEVIYAVTDPSTYSHAVFASSPLKQMEYAVVISVSLAARAAMDGGVNPYTAYDLNDLYLKQVSMASTLEEYLRILRKAMPRFALEVRLTHQKTSDSYHVIRCKNYVIHHINQKFTVADLAKDLGLNQTYISHLFSQQTGMTVKAYILQMRIEAAETMLRFSENSIHYISDYLCFQSQSYFGKKFKESTGMTPLEYRMRYHGG